MGLVGGGDQEKGKQKGLGRECYFRVSGVNNCCIHCINENTENSSGKWSETDQGKKDTMSLAEKAVVCRGLSLGSGSRATWAPILLPIPEGLGQVTQSFQTSHPPLDSRSERTFTEGYWGNSVIECM